MADLKHNRRSTLYGAILISWAFAACGRHHDGAGSASEYTLPDGFLNPQVAAVPVGSRDVVASPPAGQVKGSLLVKLLSEPGAKIRYSFRAFAEDQAVDSLTDYTEGLTLLPPVTVWAQAEKDGARGAVKSFAYDYDPTYWPAPVALSAVRLPTSPILSLASRSDLVSFTATGADERLTNAIGVDGLSTDWSGQSREAVIDASGDVPEFDGSIDLTWVEAGESDDSIYIVLATRERPKTGEGVFYGIDIGLSNISFASFGPGTTFLYRAEVTKGALVLQDKATGTSIPSAGSHVFVGEVLELQLAKADMPLLGAKTDLALRPYTVDFTHGPTISDRMEPFFLRSTFALSRGVIGGEGRPWQLDLMVPPSAPDVGMVGAYQDYASTFLPELERINSLRFYNRGTLPLFLAEKDENGYAGLNTTDRGLLSTIGPMTGALSRAQILAHELAHYQNARSSELKPRWLQEGMSEWSAERLLYLHFPPRAVHRFLKRLRFDRLVGVKAGSGASLSHWGTDLAPLGYEKSLAFLDLLEARFGQAPLIKAFQQAVNEPMDSTGFRTFLEHETGQDLTSVFAGWVDDGTMLASLDPDLLFADPDGDGLTTLDEQLRHTDPSLPDTDGDGYTDAEEVFGNTDPLISSLDPDHVLNLASAPVLVDASSLALSALTRIGGAAGVSFQYSTDPFEMAPATAFVRPTLLRPPYSISVQGHDDTGTGPRVVLQRDLIVNGMTVTPVPPADALLPANKLNVKSIPSPTSTGTGLGTISLPQIDTAGDMPPEVSAYDLTSTITSEDSTDLTITIKTVSKPDSLGEYGEYDLLFNEVDWFAPSSELYTANTRYGISLVGGAPYLSTYDAGGSRTTALLAAGIEVIFGNDLTLKIKRSVLPQWYAATSERSVCIYSEVTLDGGDKFQDRAGCTTLSAQAVAVSAAVQADAYGIGSHTVEAFVLASSSAATRAAGLAKLGAAAIREFERALGRPLLERNHWPLHVHYTASGAASGSGSQQVGAFLEIPSVNEGSVLDYLVVEQLARVVAADILAKNGGAPYWVQETFIQWLTGAAMYAMYPTVDVHDFHRNRLLDYRSVLPNAFDQPLSQWNAASPFGSSGSEKSLAFMLELNAKLGSATLSRAFSTFAQGIPDGDGLLSRLKGEAPSAAAMLDSLWTIWVDGSSNANADMSAIRARMADQDGDHLMVIDEDKLGFSDTSFNAGF